MLFPWTEQRLMVEEFPLAYFYSLYTDILREDPEFGGYMVFAEDDVAHYLLFDKGQPAAFCQFDALTNRLFPQRERPHSFFTEMNRRTWTQVVSCDEGLVKMLLTVMTQPSAAWVTGPEPWTDIEKRLGNYSLSVVLRREDQISELALYQGEQFQVGYRYDHGLGIYQRDNEEGWKSGAHNGPHGLFPISDEIIPHPRMPKPYDPLRSTVEKYAVIFNKIQDVLLKTIGVKAQQGIANMISGLREKYPPLYQGITFDPQSGKVNWQVLYENRAWVDTDFRYEKFFLYLDEVLYKLLGELRRKTGDTGMRQFSQFLSRMAKASPDITHPITLEFFQRIGHSLQGRGGRA